MKKLKSRNIRSSWNDEIHEIKDPSDNPTGNDKNHDIDELAEYSHPISTPHKMIQFMRVSIP